MYHTVADVPCCPASLGCAVCLPCVAQSGAALAAQGITMLEAIGKETAEIIAAETGMELERDDATAEHGGGHARALLEGPEGAEEKEELEEDEATFDRCFYIYGGPEHLEVCALADVGCLQSPALRRPH